ncbi:MULTISPECIES: HU family DNA-binding protein [Streptomyces]|uniref:DNA-binding protein HU 2 n=1 Tax=Streptomyces tsukubensis (strain DSM 42081 / NBRC 108919 / NRRL 18488 / 9993) TaxID=1114943 RepID=I2N6Z7_STRT9|nr:HU family DNA-binding protein [Streptomyces tsukubensis]MYS65423.1 DNA-binding protein [Streptomyces sp. SID5473]AZK96733.1 DNA-binding protein [Streptomyces tsukubensis]EIF92794.1 histone family protein DNA-binding protein [Streptomyces tsukubensis NRRL18488]QKM67275.1 HU family DNA-binding protein [Streptomyces tsukubensis NRRL18488]TAI41977.1 HU family DNA-binding protein [Streptomyces tsukubensis]
MNKAQLVEAIADKLGGRQQAADAVDAVLDAIVRAVVGGDRVSVTGFGSFEKVERPARYARNPQTGERVRVKKTSVPRFRAGQGFKDLVSGAKKLPRGGEVSVKKAPKGSLSGGASTRTTAKAAAKKATAKKAAAKKTVAKKAAPAKKAAVKKTAAKKATTTKKAAAKKTTAKKAAPAKKATAKKTAPAKKATAKKAPAKKTTARTTAAKKTTARKR